MYTEDDLLPISALQHLVFCERQCALIHVERQWHDNAQTLEGTRLHQRTDESGPRVETRGDIVVLRRLALRSLSLGLIGRSDVVELHRFTGDGIGARVPGFNGAWTIVPIEYKRGKPKRDQCDEAQLCAQAMCLEEMLDARVDRGYLFYGKRRRRHEVALDSSLREATQSASERLRRIIDLHVSPEALVGAKCDSCSLLEICIPSVTGNKRSALRYLASNTAAVLLETDYK